MFKASPRHCRIQLTQPSGGRLNETPNCINFAHETRCPITYTRRDVRRRRDKSALSECTRISALHIYLPLPLPDPKPNLTLNPNHYSSSVPNKPNAPNTKRLFTAHELHRTQLSFSSERVRSNESVHARELTEH